ncbi:Alpha/Beta hydrolase protein [Ilyonectria robusta]|uniref:Alpha/Beta hydrolase protein n=1 Tax=Ilyonectria robusta TaxID=1079257 RepID=UPI001E8DBDB8|nr:Alpha/Beta hydrolase protein [Ilyonectria robusta]KAH8683832.1 Alpha/Beta hydrolase protein [Ilyonectria robusta]
MFEKLTARLDPSLPKGVVSRFVGLNSPSTGRFPTGQHPCQGMYYHLENTTPSVAIMFSHYSADFTEHYLAGPLAAQGFGVLGWNTRYRGFEDIFILEKAIEDIGVGTEWLKKEAGVKKIVFIGNSGGGSLMAAFHGTAQNDPSLVAADAFIFLNAHPGRPGVMTKMLDPSVIDENDLLKRDPSLDMYNPAHKIPYSQEFIKRYRAAQIERNHRITAWAKAELKRLNDVGIPDRLFSLQRSVADLRFTDTTIDPSDRPANACFVGDPELANRDFPLIGRTSSLKTWLSMWSLSESKTKLEVYAGAFRVPTLVVQCLHDTGVYPSDARDIFDMVVSEDKELKFVSGSHFFEKVEDLKVAVALMTEWVQKRT